MHTLQFTSKLETNLREKKALYQIAAIIFGTIFIAVAAQITIPMQPVPVTLQSFAALLIGMAFGSKMGTTIILAYLLEGILGLPVFANFSWGLHVFFGPTGGYLIGFIPAAFLAGYLLEHGWAKHRLSIFFAAFFGTLALFIPGYLVLSNYVGSQNAYTFGVAPFYAVEFCKLIVFTLITPYFWRQTNKKV